jgi:DNA-binding transcriptional ArsR family regulator
MARTPAAVFEALGDPVRRHVLLLISAGELPAGEIVAQVRERTPMSQPAVSQHLRALREASLVTVRAEGNRRLYALDPEGIAVAQAWLAQLVEPAAALGSPLDALATEVARGKRERRQTSPSDASESGRGARLA